MRTSRIKVFGVDPALFAAIHGEPGRFFGHVESLSLRVPDWASMTLLSLHAGRSTVEACFFEESQGFFLDYTKKLLRRKRDEYLYACFARSPGGWSAFAPPTLIGPGLRTKLRATDGI